jgi:hypothetical protein
MRTHLFGSYAALQAASKKKCGNSILKLLFFGKALPLLYTLMWNQLCTFRDKIYFESAFIMQPKCIFRGSFSMSCNSEKRIKLYLKVLGGIIWLYY